MSVELITSSLLNGIRHGFFTRKGGVSVGNSLNCGMRQDEPRDALQNVQENRKRAMDGLGVPVDSLQTLVQEHGTVVFDANQAHPVRPTPRADALMTDRCDVTLGILTADCVPILIADKKKNIVAAVHAGWKGALKGIVSQTLNDLVKKGGILQNTVAVIGPCIHQESYEVGTEVKDAFSNQDLENHKFFLQSNTPNKFLFDLPGYVASQLTKFPLHDFEILPHNTYVQEDLFFSYRRDHWHRESSFVGNQLSAISMIK